MLVIFGAAPSNFTSPVSVAASAETGAAAGAAAAGVPGAVLAATVVVVCSSSSPSSSFDASFPLPQAIDRTSVAANNSETNFFIVIDLSPVLTSGSAAYGRNSALIARRFRGRCRRWRQRRLRHRH